MPKAHLLYQNGIVVLIWPCTSLPGDAQLDAALTCLAGLVRTCKSFGP